MSKYLNRTTNSVQIRPSVSVTDKGIPFNQLEDVHLILNFCGYSTSVCMLLTCIRLLLQPLNQTCRREKGLRTTTAAGATDQKVEESAGPPEHDHDAILISSSIVAGRDGAGRRRRAHQSLRRPAGHPRRSRTTTAGTYAWRQAADAMYPSGCPLLR